MYKRLLPLLLTLSGCAAAPEITADVSPEVFAAVGVAVDQSRQQIENDLWAVLVLVLGVIVTGGLLLVAVIWLIVRSYSYLRQKPVWEQRRNGAGNQGCTPAGSRRE